MIYLSGFALLGWAPPAMWNLTKWQDGCVSECVPGLGELRLQLVCVPIEGGGSVHGGGDGFPVAAMSRHVYESVCVGC